MPVFAFETVDMKGDRRRETVEAADFSEAQRKLEERGAFILQSVPSAEILEKRAALRTGKVTRRDLIEFYIYMGTLLDAGVSLLVALQGFSEESENPRLATIVERIALDLQEGRQLHESLKSHPTAFTEEMVQMVRAGEESGNLAETFKELRLYLEWLDRLLGDIRQATMYPIIVSVALFGFVLCLFTLVVPRITALLVAMKVDIPLITRIIMGISSMFVNTWWAWIAGLVLLPVLYKLAASRFPKVALWIDQAKLSIPVFGPLNRMIAISRFSQNFAILQKAGLPILQNLTLCKGMVGNRVVAAALDTAIVDVSEGLFLSESLRKSPLFKGLALRMVSAGETSGSLEKTLAHVSRYYNEEIPRQIKKVFGFVEPAIILFLVSVVGTVAVAIFLPLLSITGGVH